MRLFDETYEVFLGAELVLDYLLVPLLVQIGGLNLVLEEFQFIRLGAELLDLASFALILHLHASHLSGQTFLHLLHVDGSGRWGSETSDTWALLGVLLVDAGVESGLSESHVLEEINK